jgi:lysophospholipase L1-like esterase
MTVFDKNILFVFALMTSLFANSQSNAHAEMKYGFVNEKENYIHFYSENANFNKFYKKLHTLLSKKRGKVRIMQIGGSHIQAEIWPDQVRMDFLGLTDSINGGRGFVFPFKMAKTWNPKNHQISFTGKWESLRNSVKKHKEKWGVSGITVKTKDSISSFQMGYKHDSLTNYSFNRIKVFHDMDASSFKVSLVSDIPKKIIENKELGFTEFFLEKSQDSLFIEIRKTNHKQTHFNLYGLSLENDDPGIVYTSIGVNGAKTSSYLRNEMFVDQLKTVNPDLVVFCIGINDAYYDNFKPKEYTDNYEKLMQWIQSVNPNVEFLFVTNNDSYFKRKYPNKRVFKAREVMVDLAKKHDAGLWDLFEVMGGLGSVKYWEENGYAKADKIHFTDKGYQLIGNLMFQALMNDYDKYLKLVNEN